jgi:hypothetical protein
MISKYSSILYDCYQDALPEGSLMVSIDGLHAMVNSLSQRFCNEPCNVKDFNIFLKSVDMGSPVNRSAPTLIPFSKIEENSCILY